jgi:dTMP kinase
MNAFFHQLPAYFVSFEGIDGCGKSTLLNDLATWLEEHSIPLVKTREPGGTRLGEKLREMLLDPLFSGMHEHTEVLLYSASRAQLVHEVVRPALRRGMWALADRYIDATLAYQGFGRGLERESLCQLQDWATGGLWPDFTVLLDCDVAVASSRLKDRAGAADRIESENLRFHERVREGYLELARSAPGRFIVVDGSRPIEEVTMNFRTAFVEALSRRH